ncbi:MAG: SPASM domain-containing protein [Desulfobacterota bacterium]|nr:SPASM domain-containing protein [Thermodesulfobacteriota bacterium]
MFLGPDDVDMALDARVYERVAALPAYEEVDEVMIHYTVTQECPFNCRGCINALTAGKGNRGRSEAFPGIEKERNLERDLLGISRLIRDSGKSTAVIVFYGGEPMLRLEPMSHLHRVLPRVAAGSACIKTMVITSGHFLEKAIRDYPDLISGMWLTALSIDGNEEQHDAVRRGTSLRKIRRQVAALNQVRKGEVLIWATLRPEMSLWDCFDSFMYFRKRGEAEHFFWHCDEGDGMIPDLPLYLEAYRRDLEKIIGGYLDHLKRGDLLSLIHVNDLLLYLFTRKRRGTSACAVERMENFDIIGDGRVHACADLPEAMSIGRILDSGEIVFEADAREKLQKMVSYKGELGCSRCGVEPYCGGRCPVQANTGGIGRARQYCFMIRGCDTVAGCGRRGSSDKSGFCLVTRHS